MPQLSLAAEDAKAAPPPPPPPAPKNDMERLGANMAAGQGRVPGVIPEGLTRLPLSFSSSVPVYLDSRIW